MKTLYKFTIKADENHTGLYINDEKLPYSGMLEGMDYKPALAEMLRDLSKLALEMAILAE